MKKYLPFLLLAIFALLPIHAQEALLSENEQYYEFLVLEGMAERPYLNYRTLSDSGWEILSAGHPWDGLYLGESRGEDIRYRLYGPELFSSYNSSAPWGSNDGVLWQGKGFNSSFTAGARLEAWGFELTLKPMISFSQNLSFDLVPPAYTDTNFEGKAADYGYFGVKHIDAPQRFGDEPFFDWSLGDSEIRYTWKTITAGFGTQAIWLGPGKINSIMHSNNAAPYPKLDIGLRRTELYLPWLGWYLGDVEGRAWWGRTTESDYFDNNSDNDHNLLTGLSLSYSPPFAPGLVFGFHRTMLSLWQDWDWEGIFTLLWPFMSTDSGQDVRDQRASLTAQYTFPEVGLDVYLEWGRNDYSSSMDMIVRYPFHTQAYTIGGVKTFALPWYDLKGEVCVEITNLESSRDYEFLWPTTFYAHHQIRQGYTNEGQWLGAGIGTGGNSQYIGAKLYYNRGYAKVFAQRVNPDNDYIWFMNFGKTIPEKQPDEKKIKAFLIFGADFLFFVNKSAFVKAELILNSIHNPIYMPDERSPSKSQKLFNVYASLLFSYDL